MEQYKLTAPISAVLTLRPCGGTCDTTTLSVKKGQAIGTLPTPTLDGYSFLGWYTAPYGGTEVTSSTVATESMTLYAHWWHGGRVLLNYNCRGGTIPDDEQSWQIDGFDVSRGLGELIIYQQITSPDTNSYGVEMAVNSAGRITAYRPYAQSSGLTVPSGGFIVSAQDNGAGSVCKFFESIHASGYQYIGIDYESGTVTAYRNYAAYLAGTKRLQEYDKYGELPIPTREGYYLDCWYVGDYYTGSNIRATETTSFAGKDLYAYWVEIGSVNASAAMTYNGHNYERFDLNMTWEEAKAFCEQRGGHLVTIANANENAAVVGLLSGCPFGMYYIGATDARQEETWEWVTGESFSYNNWDTDYQEGNNGTDENCCAMIGIENPPNKQVGEWIDTSNDLRGRTDFYRFDNCGFICEYEYTHTHSYNYVLTKAPTLTSTGTLTGTCTDPDCGNTVTVTLPKLNTTDYSYQVTTAPTCQQTGAGEYTWTGSGSVGTWSFEVTLPTIDHEYTAQEVPGHCTTPPMTVYTCTMCGDSYSEISDAAWSEWSTERPTGVDDSQIQSRTEYRTRDRSETTSSSSTLDGWTLYDTEQVWGEWGAWSDWSSDAVTANDSTDVDTATVYKYYYFYCPVCGGHEPFTGKSDCGNYTLSGSDWHECWSDVPYSQCNYQTFSYTTRKYYTTSLPDGEVWCFSSGNLNDTAIGTVDADSGGSSVVITNGYRYRTRTQTTVYLFYRWEDWSDWSATPETATDYMQVETRTVYRYYLYANATHTWDNGTVTTPATCTGEGVRTYTCSVCGETRTEAIPALGHDWGEPVWTWTGTTAASAKFTCKNNSAHVQSVTASITSSTTAATCETAGNTVYTATVTFNGKTYTDTKTETIPALGHDWGPWVVTTEATVDQPGVEARTCSRCGKTETRNYNAEVVTVMFDANGGSVSTSSVRILKGGCVSALPTPTREGYLFDGWFTAADGGTKITTSTTFSANATVYAHWILNYYTVSYDANGGTGAPEAQTKTYGVALTLSNTTPTRVNASAGSFTVTLDANGGSVSSTSLSAARTTSYSFKNWNTAANGSGTSYAPGASYTENAAVTLYAQWNSSTSTAAVTLPTPTREGFIFKGWSVGENGTERITGSFTPEGDVTLVAVWEAMKYTVEFVNDDGTVLQTGEVDYGTIPVYTGPTPTKAATAQYSYSFNGWDKPLVAVTGAATYTATYSSAINTYTITWVDGDGVTLKTEEVAYGETPSYTGATPTKTGTAQYTYTFKNAWLPEITDVTGPATYTAQFIRAAVPGSDLDIDEDTFPDEVFRDYVSTNFDTNHNGKLSEEEIAAVVSISIKNKDVYSLEGVEFFTQLESLTCSGTHLSSLDVSSNTELKKITVNHNELTELDVSNNTKLKEFNCNSNQIDHLIIGDKPALVHLNCCENQLTVIDLSGYPELLSLACDDNRLSELDISMNPKLYSLNCSNNAISDLDITQCPKLIETVRTGIVKTSEEFYNPKGEFVSYSKWIDYALRFDKTTRLTANGEVLHSETVFSICFHGNGGYSIPETMTKTFDTDVTLPAEKPTRSGGNAGTNRVTLDANGGSVSTTTLDAKRTTSYSFNDWNSAENGSGTSYEAGAVYSANADVTLYAQWITKTTTETVTLPTPTRGMDVFLGWAESSTAETPTYLGGESITPSGNMTLYALWKSPDLVLPANTTVIGEQAFFGGAFSFVKLSEKTTTIGSMAFACCEDLAYIYIPASTTSIDKYAFVGVNSLTILGEEGSYAQTFAAENGYAFLAVKDGQYT